MHEATIAALPIRHHHGGVVGHPGLFTDFRHRLVARSPDGALRVHAARKDWVVGTVSARLCWQRSGAKGVADRIGWLKRRGGTVDDYLFPSRVNRDGHITTRQYARLVDEWLEAVGLDPASYGAHSLRRTKVSVIYKRTGNLRAVQILLGHTKLASTARYLGVDVDDALTLAEATDI